jgi:site-specific DNA recombinase
MIDASSLTQTGTAAIYARKSTAQRGVDDDAKSVTRQIAHAHAYAERQGWLVPESRIYVDDGVSGAEFERRPALMRLLNALTPRPPFQALLLVDADRIGREQIESGYILKQVIRAGVRVIECKGAASREITLGSPIDKMILAIEGFATEVEREKARQRTADAMLRKAKAGHVAGGRIFGYDNIRVDGHVERRINATAAGSPSAGPCCGDRRGRGSSPALRGARRVPRACA